MLALISVHCIVPPFSDVYYLYDMSACPLIFLAQYLGIVPIYIVIVWLMWSEIANLCKMDLDVLLCFLVKC